MVYKEVMNSCALQYEHCGREYDGPIVKHFCKSALQSLIAPLHYHKIFTYYYFIYSYSLV